MQPSTSAQRIDPPAFENLFRLMGEPGSRGRPRDYWDKLFSQHSHWLHQVSANRTSLVCMAIVRNNATALAALLKAGADPNGPYGVNELPVFRCLEHGNVRTFRQLVRAGLRLDLTSPNPDPQTKAMGQTILMRLIRDGRWAHVQDIALQANWDIADAAGETPAHLLRAAALHHAKAQSLCDWLDRHEAQNHAKDLAQALEERAPASRMRL